MPDCLLTSTTLMRARSRRNQRARWNRRNRNGFTPNTWCTHRLATTPRQIDLVKGSRSPGHGIMVARALEDDPIYNRGNG
jgi:Tfp pilus assembly protein PilV